MLKQRIIFYAVTSGFTALAPIPGLSIGVDMGLLLKMSHDFTKAFGLTGDQVEGPYEKISARAKVAAILSKVGALLTSKGIIRIVTSQATETAVEEFVRYVPLIGQLASAALSFGGTYLSGRILLSSMKKLALEMADEVIQYQSEKEDFSLNETQLQGYQQYEQEQTQGRQNMQPQELSFGQSPRQVQQQVSSPKQVQPSLSPQQIQQVSSPKQVQPSLSPQQVQQLSSPKQIQQVSSPKQVQPRLSPQQVQQQVSSPKQIQQVSSPKQIQQVSSPKQVQPQSSSPRQVQQVSPHQLYPAYPTSPEYSQSHPKQNYTERYQQYA